MRRSSSFAWLAFRHYHRHSRYRPTRQLTVSYRPADLPDTFHPERWQKPSLHLDSSDRRIQLRTSLVVPARPESDHRHLYCTAVDCLLDHGFQTRCQFTRDPLIQDN
jgi:hypothetical protein